MARAAFTLLEVVVVIAIVLVLVGMLLSAITVVGRRADAAATRALVAQVHQACQVYRGEDKKRRFPPAVADGVLYVEVPDRDRTWDGTTPLAGNMLGRVGLRVHGERTAPVGARLALADAWGEPLRYHLDAIADGIVDRPRDGAGAQLLPGDAPDWNPQGAEPHAYVWSCGRPHAGSTLKAQAAQWHYVQEAPRP